jgi:curved DNA-binding protein CbpA
MSHSLQEAYQSLGLEPGCSFENAKLRYRSLAKTSHPDNALAPNKKLLAEQQMKTFNLQFEIVESHFKKDHSEHATCACRQWQSLTKNRDTSSKTNAGAGSNAGSSSRPGATTSSKTNASASSHSKQTARPKSERVPDPNFVDPLAAERIMQDAARSIWRNKVAYKNQEQQKSAYKAPTITDFILKQSE